MICSLSKPGPIPPELTHKGMQCGHTETDHHCWLNHRKRTMAADIPNIKKTNQAFMNREIIYY